MKDTCILSRECDARDSSLQEGNLCRYNKFVRCAQNRGPTRWSHLKVKQSTTSTPLEERVKMGRYGSENSPAKAAGHFSQLLDGKLP